MIDSLTLEEFVFAVRWSRRRKTIGISVARGGALALAVPVGCSRRRLETAVRAKLPWVRVKLAELDQLGEPQPPRQYVDGETFSYLGRTYSLHLVAKPHGAKPHGAKNQGSSPLRLYRGRFELDRAAAGEGRERFVAWYTEHGRRWAAARGAEHAPRVGVTPTVVRVRELGRRWGSCSAKGVVDLHWAIMLLPAHVADYVIVHELAHLRELNHGAGFWHLVAEVMPDYRQHRLWLKRHGHGFVI